MYLVNIAVSNYHTFTYHDELTLIKGMEFDTDPYSSNVNILVGPNGSGKSNFLDLITLLCSLHHNPKSTEILPNPQKSSIKKHPGFESYPSTILAQWMIGGASEEHTITIQYNLDDMTYKTISEHSTNDINPQSTQRNYHHLMVQRPVTSTIRHHDTIDLIRDHLGLIYNPHNQSYLTAGGAIRKRDDLGSGEKSIIWIINEILTHNCVGGIVLIDEPELHLHPKYQRNLGAILNTLSQQTNSQIIIATHSPFFINETNIENVFKFSIKHGHTHLTNPVEFQGQDQARVKQILTDGNMSKLFFTDTVIMVEGETDEYFLNHYIKHYFKTHNIQSRRYNYEILNIAGKSSLRAWRSFCNQFGIQRSFIGDWDNVISSSPYGSQIEQIRSKTNLYRNGRKINKSDQYKSIIQTISDHHPELAKHIKHRITQQEKRNIHILQHGDLEAYLDLPDKGLDVTIDRCNTEFTKWSQNPLYSHYHQDLDTIITSILKL